MKPIEINESSTLFYFLHTYSNWYPGNPDHLNICAITKYFCLSILVCLCIIGISSVFLGLTLFPVIGTLVAWLYIGVPLSALLYTPEGIAAAVLLGFSLLVSLAAWIGYISHTGKLLSVKTILPNIAIQAYDSWKNKYCTPVKINWD